MSSLDPDRLSSVACGAVPPRPRPAVDHAPVRVAHRLPAPLLPVLRTAAKGLPEQIIVRIGAEVPVLLDSERLRPVVADAVAVQGFFEDAAIRFRELGRAGAGK